MIFVESEENSLEQEYIEKIKQRCFTNNTETNHIKADIILCEFLKELGYEDIVGVYKSVYKRYLLIGRR